MSKQIDFLKRCIALNLQSGGLLDLLDRIEELERENNELAARIGKELNEENLALRAEIAELVRVLGNVTAHLVAAHSLLSRGGKKAAASDTIFKIMLQDYEKSFEAGRKALAKVRKP